MYFQNDIIKIWGDILRILFCDDDKASLDILNEAVREYMAEKGYNYESVSTSVSSQVMKNKDVFDLAFLDIQMVEVDGLSLAGELKKRNNNVIIFFVTNYEHFQDDAMDLRVFRFFNKPLEKTRLFSGLDKAMEYLNDSYVEIYLKNCGEYTKIAVNDICYIKRENRKVIVVTKDCQYETTEKLEDLHKKLPHTFFYLVHKSFLINLHFVTKYSYTEVYVNDTRISVATRKQVEFHKYWFNYLRGK